MGTLPKGTLLFHFYPSPDEGISLTVFHDV